MSTPARVPTGVPTGGRFAAAPRGESNVDLGSTHPGSAQAALDQALAERMDMSDDPRTSARLRELEQAAAAEQAVAVTA